ncbi:MAG: glycosyltransferase, partial [Elusimicrobiota bacterium]
IPPGACAPPAVSGPPVRVCIPAYNCAATIAASLESILGQSYRNLSVIVVDNASVDDTAKIVESYAGNDGRLSLVKNPVNIGAENNFTRCIELAGGVYTAIYHADDVYEPRMVERAVAFLEENPAAGAVFTAALEIDSAGNTIGRRRIPAELPAGGGRAFSFDEIFRTVLRRGNYLTFPTALVRTSVYRDEIRAWNGGKYRTSADLDVWLRIAEKHSIGLIDEPLLNYRVSTVSFSYTYSRLRTQRQDMFLVLEDYVKKYSGRLDAGAREDYRLLSLKDDISVAINHIIRNEQPQARLRLRGIFAVKNVLGSLRSLAQLKFLAIGYAAFFAAWLPLGAAGRKALAAVRHKG